MKLRSKRFLLINLIFLLLVVSHYLKLTQVFEQALIKGLLPIERLSANVSNFVFNTGEIISSIKDLRQLNLDLKTENQKLKAELNRLKEVEVDNKYLRQQLDFISISGFKTYEARVIGYNLDNIGQSFLIDLGQTDDPVIGQAVVDSNGFLVGVIESIFPKSARVLLITDRASLVSVRLQTSRADGLISGDYGLEVILSQVPDTEKVETGDKIITAGLSEEMPGGILIGEVEEVWQQTGDLFQSAKIKTYADFNGLERVFVVKFQ